MRTPQKIFWEVGTNATLSLEVSEATSNVTNVMPMPEHCLEVSEASAYITILLDLKEATSSIHVWHFAWRSEAWRINKEISDAMHAKPSLELC